MLENTHYIVKYTDSADLPVCNFNFCWKDKDDHIECIFLMQEKRNRTATFLENLHSSEMLG